MTDHNVYMPIIGKISEGSYLLFNMDHMNVNNGNNKNFYKIMKMDVKMDIIVQVVMVGKSMNIIL